MTYIKTVQLNMYPEDGQPHTSSNNLVSLKGRNSVVVNSANAWYENNRIIANPSNHQGMLLGNTEHHFHISRILGWGFKSESMRAPGRATTCHHADFHETLPV